jgi:hypothetical protein
LRGSAIIGEQGRTVDYLSLAVAIACAVFWYRGAQHENISPLLWVGPSLAISIVVSFGLNQGWIAVAMGQLALFFAITIYRTVVDERKRNE